MKTAVYLAIALSVAFAVPVNAQPTSAADRAFRTQADAFVQAELRLYPERATRLGDHRFDNRVDDLSAHGIDEVIHHAKKWIALFGAD
ncbi:MAG TPA: hypothetical protein VE243_08020, partial [Candidatus Acidoferrum sp.]|nr:hypothetical protein [Candidatus Acidoferrum sp.]